MARQVFITVFMCVCFGCAGSDRIEETLSGPRVMSADRDSVVIGETLYFQARDVLSPDDGISRLNFIGTFVGESGTRHPVDVTVTPLYDEENDEGATLRLSRIGPFHHPFVPDDRAEPGYFEGQVYVVSVPFEGMSSIGPAKDIRLEIAPSLAIETWEPVIADCGVPALRGLGGLAYIMTVRAVGFEPVLFRYILGQVNGEPLVLIEQAATGQTDTIGTPDNILMLNDVASDDSYYATSWSIEAEDAQGNVYENILPFTVHRPLDHFTDPRLEEAEFLEPVPVSSCFKGSLGTDVVYSESSSETRQNSASVTLSRSWTTTRGQTRSDTWRDSVSIGTSDAQSRTRQVALTEGDSTTQTYGVTYSQSEANSLQTASSNGESWTTSLDIGDTTTRNDTSVYETSSIRSNTWEAGLSVSVFDFGGSVGSDQTVTSGSRQSNSSSIGRQSSTNRGFSSQSSRNTTRSFGTTTTDARSNSIGGAYALNRAQTTTDSEGRVITISEGRTIDLGGSESRSNTITEGETEAYQRTFTESSTSTTLTSYDGVVPRTKFGVFYRQTVRLIRKTYLRSFNLCGVSSIMGEIQYNQWTWAPDLALGDECPPFPESNLPPAQCLIEPCGESL
ncbi:MAG: hypothetical protein VYA30_13850 [Myxococcota bacterium]|nr:hypothetical protein [Myxococcota bacterium]